MGKQSAPLSGCKSLFSISATRAFLLLLFLCVLRVYAVPHGSKPSTTSLLLSMRADNEDANAKYCALKDKGDKMLGMIHGEEPPKYSTWSRSTGENQVLGALSGSGWNFEAFKQQLTSLGWEHDDFEILELTEEEDPDDEAIPPEVAADVGFNFERDTLSVLVRHEMHPDPDNNDDFETEAVYEDLVNPAHGAIAAKSHYSPQAIAKIKGIRNPNYPKVSTWADYFWIVWNQAKKGQNLGDLRTVFLLQVQNEDAMFMMERTGTSEPGPYPGKSITQASPDDFAAFCGTSVVASLLWLLIQHKEFLRLEPKEIRVFEDPRYKHNHIMIKIARVE